MPSVTGRANTSDGRALLTRHWQADDPWASLLLIHGLGEHSGRYEHVGDYFSAAGLDTYGYDHRGNAGSDGPRGDIDRWSRYHDDMAERLTAVLSRDSEVGRRLLADPLNGRASTARFGAEVGREQQRVTAGAKSIGGPTLVIHGLDDGLVPASASEPFEGAPGVEAPDVPGSPARAAQRTGMAGCPRRRGRLDPGACYASSTTEHRLRGARRALRVWRSPQTRRT